MIGARRIIAVIPARGGSKGLPGKNIALLGDRPLIAWSIDAARGSKYIDDIVVSTDDPAIANAAQKWGAAVVNRPAELASDVAPVEGALLHAVDSLDGGWDILVLLQPTSPLRRAEDIDGCIETMVKYSAPCALTVSDPGKPPYWMYTLGESGKMLPVVSGIEALRRQDLPVAYALNGAVYVADIVWLRKNGKFMSADTVAYLMPRERSIDIDTPMDLTIAKALVGSEQ